MSRPVVTSAVAAVLVGALLVVHLRVIEATSIALATTVAVVAGTALATATVTSRVVSSRDAQLRELRKTVARIRTDQKRAKKQSPDLIVDEPSDEE